MIADADTPGPYGSAAYRQAEDLFSFLADKNVELITSGEHWTFVCAASEAPSVRAAIAARLKAKPDRWSSIRFER